MSSIRENSINTHINKLFNLQILETEPTSGEILELMDEYLESVPDYPE